MSIDILFQFFWFLTVLKYLFFFSPPLVPFFSFFFTFLHFSVLKHFLTRFPFFSSPVTLMIYHLLYFELFFFFILFIFIIDPFTWLQQWSFIFLNSTSFFFFFFWTFVRHCFFHHLLSTRSTSACAYFLVPFSARKIYACFLFSI